MSGAFAIRKDHRHTFLTCPACGYRCDASSQLTPAGDPSPDHSPRDGDASLCLACASVNVYANDATALRPPTVEERDEFTADPQIQSATRSLLEVKEREAGTWPKGTKR